MFSQSSPARPALWEILKTNEQLYLFYFIIIYFYNRRKYAFKITKAFIASSKNLLQVLKTVYVFLMILTLLSSKPWIHFTDVVFALPLIEILFCKTCITFKPVLQ